MQKLLNELEKSSSIYWNISRETAVFLKGLAGSIQAKNILEIGTSNGYSGIWLAKACEHLTTVESHGQRFELARKNFAKARLSHKITQIKGHAPEALAPIKQKFDLIFLDATKYEYPQYLKFCLPLLTKKGLIVADNIDSHASGLKPFFAAAKKIKSIKIPIGTGLLVLKPRLQVSSNF